MVFWLLSMDTVDDGIVKELKIKITELTTIEPAIKGVVLVIAVESKEMISAEIGVF